MALNIYSKAGADTATAAAVAAHKAETDPHPTYTTAAEAAAAAPVQSVAGRTGAVTIGPADVTGTAVITTDPRLSDSRTPTTHGHTAAQVSGVIAALTPQQFGAVGDGVANDTAALQAWLTAAPAAGGLLHLPAGKYLTTGGLTCAAPVQIIGAGTGGYETASGGARILCASTTATVLTLSAPGSVVSGVTFESTAAMGTQTAGAALLCTDFDWGRVERCFFVGFWNQIQIDAGYFYVIRDSAFMRPVNFGAYLRNTAAGQTDHGDWLVSGCTFSRYGDPVDRGTAVRWESGGGLRLIGNKMNSLTQPGYPSTGAWYRGFDLYLTGAGDTSVCIIDGNSIEGMRTGEGIKIAGSSGAKFYGITITGNEMYHLGTPACIDINGSDMSYLKGITIASNFLRGGVSLSLAAVTDVAVTGNDFTENASTCLTFSQVKRAKFAGNCLKGLIIDNDIADWASGGHDRRWGYFVDEAGITTTRAYGRVAPSGYSAGVLTVKVAGDVQTVGGITMIQSRAVSLFGSSVVVGATIGTDVAIGTAAAELSITLDVATTAASIIPKVTSVNGKNFRGSVEVFYDGIAYNVVIP